jgi:hypothetical protein
MLQTAPPKVDAQHLLHDIPSSVNLLQNTPECKENCIALPGNECVAKAGHASNRQGCKPWLIRRFVAVDDRINEGHAFQPVICEREVPPQHARGAIFVAGSDGFREAGVKVGESFQIAFGMTRRRPRTGLCIFGQVVSAPLDGLHPSV